MFSPDDLAGVVDLFGALEREELAAALSELAYRRDETIPEGVVDDALEHFGLVAIDLEGAEHSPADSLLAAGPTAFPALPAGAEDLPHILDVEPRTVDRETVGRAAEARLRSEAAHAAADGDRERIDELVDVSYDLEAWAPVDLGDVRTRLDDARNETN